MKVRFTNWKHYVSDWKPLKIVGQQFKTLEYDAEESEKFPEVENEEIVKEIIKYIGMRIAIG